MPFLPHQCATCDRSEKRWHNAKKCRACGGPLIREGARPRGWAERLRSLESEVTALLAEVNRLRVEIGLGLKYEAIDNGDGVP